MMEEGFIPTNATFNTILKGFCKEENMDKALELVDHFQRFGNAPDLVSFNTILSSACKQENYSPISWVLSRVEVEGLRLNLISMTCLIQYFCMVGNFSDCFKLVDFMIKEGHMPSTVTFNVLLYGLCKQGLVGTAYRIFHKFKNLEFSPDIFSYNILIRAFIKVKKHSFVRQLVVDLCRQNFLPDSVTCGSFIYSLCKEGDIVAALHVRDWMLLNGIAPTSSIYNTILNALFRRRMYWEIYQLMVHMAKEGIEPDIFSFSILRRAMSRDRMDSNLGIMRT
ncbi:hypothetical protein QJS10_CPA08g01518 [Acorus calamus]|uniref:Pentatricopeptide repeat-containing protein n=1 Tax=Acorus calamus TaxID=4465 RepID=A0AAV9ECQ7_ACOCL|nr:hypothetical protein QJS10_CPA08g01518 [Acorus calamus]